MSTVGELAEMLGESGSEAVARVQKELAARVEDGRSFAMRVRDQARDFLERGK